MAVICIRTVLVKKNISGGHLAALSRGPQHNSCRRGCESHAENPREQLLEYGLRDFLGSEYDFGIIGIVFSILFEF